MRVGNRCERAPAIAVVCYPHKSEQFRRSSLFGRSEIARFQQRVSSPCTSVSLEPGLRESMRISDSSSSKAVTRSVKAVGFGGPLELAWLTLTNETFPKSSLRSNVSTDGRQPRGWLVACRSR